MTDWVDRLHNLAHYRFEDFQKILHFEDWRHIHLEQGRDQIQFVEPDREELGLEELALVESDQEQRHHPLVEQYYHSLSVVAAACSLEAARSLQPEQLDHTVLAEVRNLHTALAEAQDILVEVAVGHHQIQL